MYGALLLFEDEFIHIVAISFSSLILTELIMVALNIRTWHYLMILAELISLVLYLLSLIILHDYFGKFELFVRYCVTTVIFADSEFIRTNDFIWKVLVITLVSCLPLYILKFLRKKFSPPSYSKLSWIFRNCDKDRWAFAFLFSNEKIGYIFRFALIYVIFSIKSRSVVSYPSSSFSFIEWFEFKVIKYFFINYY